MFECRGVNQGVEGCFKIRVYWSCHLEERTVRCGVLSIVVAYFSFAKEKVDLGLAASGEKSDRRR